MRHFSTFLDTTGYDEEHGYFKCAFCEEKFSSLEVYPVDGHFFTAEGMVQKHIDDVHDSVFEAILAKGKKETGLSDVHQEMLRAFYEGKTDQEIAKTSSVHSVSTIRQHRFKLREKERQAKNFLQLMAIINDQ